MKNISTEAKWAVITLLIIGAVAIPFTVTDQITHGDGWQNLKFTAWAWGIALVVYIISRILYKPNLNNR